MKSNIIQDYTSGNITQQLLIFTFPMFLSSLLQTLYNTVDMIIVGKVLGNAGLSGVSIGGDVSNVLTILIMGFASAAQIIIAQFLGAQRWDKMKSFIGTFATTLFLIAVGLSVAGVLLARNMLNWMNTPAEAYEEALSYSIVIMCGLVFVCGYNAVSSILRGLGDSSHPFIFVVISTIINIVLDLLLIVAWHMGAMGAALATIISQAVSFFCALVFLVKKKDALGFTLELKDFKIDSEMLMSLLKLGLPMALKSAAVTLSKLFTNSFVNSYGVTVSAVTGVGARISNVAAMVSNSFSASSSSMIGQNIGAEKYNRVLKIVFVVFAINMAVAVVLTPFVLIFPKQIFMLFTSDHSDATMLIALEFIPSLLVTMYSCGTRSCANALINGSGNHKLNFLLAILDAFVLRVGLSLFLGIACKMEYQGFWMGSALTGFTPLVIGGIYLISGKWKTRKYVIRE